MGDGNFPLMPSHSVGCLVTSHPMPQVPTQSSLGALALTLVLWASGWEREAGSHLQDDTIRLVEIRCTPTGTGVFLCCWPQAQKLPATGQDSEVEGE